MMLAILQQVAPSPDELGGFVEAVAKAVGAKDWRLLGGLASILVVWVLRKFLAPHVKWFGTDRGGACMALIVGVLGAVGHVLMSSQPWGFQMISDAVVMAVTAAGGWAMMKKLVSPSDKAPASPEAPPAAPVN